MSSLNRNHTWMLVDKPADQTVELCKWLLKFKDGIPSIEKCRYNARLVAYGYYYHEIFLPFVKHTSIRVLLARTTTTDMKL